MAAEKKEEGNMKSRFLTCFAAITLFAMAAIPPQLAAQDAQQPTHELPRYVVKDIGTLGGTVGQGRGINNKDWITGLALLPHNMAFRAFLRKKGRNIDLGTLGGPNSTTFYKPTEQGEVAGAAETSNPDPLGEDFCFFGTHLICLAFVWQNGTMTALPTLGGNNGTANYINNHSQVAGLAENTTLDSTCSNSEYQAEPVIWNKGVAQQLRTVSGDPDGFVNVINDEGVAVGGSGDCATSGAFSLHALLWQNGSPTDLGSLGGTLFSNAIDVNEQGQVVGASDLAGDTNFWAFLSPNTHAFSWHNGAIKDLSTLPGDPTSIAFGINNKGQIVGSGSRAIVWGTDGLIDLNTLVSGPPFSPLYLLSALDINDRGEIVGEGLAINGDLHAFLAIPCDELHGDIEGCHTEAGLSVTEKPTEPASLDATGDSGHQSDAGHGSRPGRTIFWRRPEALPSGYLFNSRAGTTRHP
jgi:probable HAF family extracellular repeat protein